MYIENKPISCRVCGSGPWNGQEQQTTNPRTGDIVVECIWICGRCGARFAQGVVQVIKNEKPKKE